MQLVSYSEQMLTGRTFKQCSFKSVQYFVNMYFGTALDVYHHEISQVICKIANDLVSSQMTKNAMITFSD